MRKSTQAGVYELDRVAPARRRQDELGEELRALTATPGIAADGSAVRTRRTELTAELGRVERTFEEVERPFEHPSDEEHALAVVHPRAA